ncbi:hypothetical protein [Cupriavidus necator]
MFNELALRLQSNEIKTGVKTGQPTVSMPIRMLKEQAVMLKAASYVEGRPVTAIVRDLLNLYFTLKQNDPDEAARERFEQAVKLHADKG